MPIAFCQPPFRSSANWVGCDFAISLVGPEVMFWEPVPKVVLSPAQNIRGLRTVCAMAALQFGRFAPVKLWKLGLLFSAPPERVKSSLVRNYSRMAEHPTPGTYLMIKMPLGFSLLVFLVCAPLCAVAQGTSQPNGVRSGYAGTNSSRATTQSPTNSPSGSPSRSSAGTSQGRSEGALGLTPQLQKEMGISRQQ